MRFLALSTDDEGFLEGVATNDRQDPARAFCDAYRPVSRRIIDPATLRLEPCFWGGEGDAGPDDDLHVLFEADEEPHLVRAVFDCLGHDQTEEDRVVMMRDEVRGLGTDFPALSHLVANHAATALAEEATLIDGLGWTAAAAQRAVMAALIVRAVEAQAPRPARALGAVYDDLCGSAVATLVRRRYPDTRNAEALFVRDNPGFAALLKRAVATVRQSAPLPLPLDVFAVEDCAKDILENCLAVAGGRFLPA